jgi:hypothetical protein
MPKDDTMIRRYNELRTRQMAIKKKVGEKDKQTRKQAKSDKKR